MSTQCVSFWLCAGSNITEFKAEDGLWCCKTTKDACTIERSNIKCTGHAIPLTQQCHNHELTSNCNYYPDDVSRNYYVYVYYYGGSSMDGNVIRSYLDTCSNNR